MEPPTTAPVLARLDQVEEPKLGRSETRSGRGLGKGEMAVIAKAQALTLKRAAASRPSGE